ncbi:hypothetical protein P5G50_08925 [Leifsonia sp. F6_8S_P_1B]|uniref:Uncharacterized protein n=1 Tax=Leifsonia williamsii TaxID=3035919 RepID=A0ABT8KAU8_9MICO|nr:hypothetical protein [Leifsonia williamsii]MDN4614574.1 hypothetical protein [Leifsonia williamsii]
MSHDVWPFRKIAEGTVEMSEWLMPEADGRELPEYLEGWDPLTDICVQRSIRCDPNAVLDDSGLPSETPLVLTVSWNNRQSFMTESAYRAPLLAEQLVELTLPAGRLGGSISLRTTIAVATTDISRPLGTARWAGSVLFEHERTVVLEGSGPMFPMTELDFSVTRYHPDASWALQLPDDLSLPVLGSVLLLINTRDADLLTALAAATPDQRQAALINELEGQVGGFLIAQAASRRIEIESEDWEEQSVGELLAGYLAIADDQGVIGTIHGDDATAISAAFQGAARAEGFGRRFG